MKMLAFGAFNRTTSINKQLEVFAVKQVNYKELTALDLNNFEVSIFLPKKEQLAVFLEK